MDESIIIIDSYNFIDRVRLPPPQKNEFHPHGPATNAGLFHSGSRAVSGGQAGIALFVYSSYGFDVIKP